MDELITICIPTYNRPELLHEAISSCITQDYRPIEILISDDSADSGPNLDVIGQFAKADDYEIRFLRNTGRKGQSGNINFLFENAKGPRLFLLHDDDILLPHSLSVLAEEWRKHTDVKCMFGKNYVMSNDGHLLDEETEDHQERYFRKPEYNGPQENPLRSAFLQQLPGSAYLVVSDLARAVRFRSEGDVGHSVDADFGIRLAMLLKPNQLVYVDHYITSYRLTVGSILRSEGYYGHELFYTYLRNLSVDEKSQEPLGILMSRIAPGAVIDAAMRRKRKLAFSILRSPSYEHRFASGHTMYRLLAIMSPQFAFKIKSLARSRR